MLKVFPASLVGGPAFLKAVGAIYRDVRFVPTGGVNPDNLAAYLELPVRARVRRHVDLRTGLLRDGRFDEVERRAREAVEIAGPVAA